MKALSNFKRSASLRLQTYGEVAGLAASIIGTSLSLIFGRAALAVVLATVALGIFLRFNSRAKGGSPTEAALPLWVKPVSAVLAALETGVLVESVNLPVRYDQAGFQLYHWGLVCVIFLALYLLQFQIFKRVAKRSKEFG